MSGHVELTLQCSLEHGTQNDLAKQATHDVAIQHMTQLDMAIGPLDSLSICLNTSRCTLMADREQAIVMPGF